MTPSASAESTMESGATTSRHWLALLCIAGLGASCSSQRAGDSVTEREAALTGSFTISIQTPPNVSPTQVALAAAGTMLINGGAKVPGPGAAPSVVSNMGTGGVDVEPDAQLGTLWSAATVTLKDRVHLTGKVFAPHVTPGNGVLVDGGIDSTTPRTPVSVTSWTVVYPSTAAPDVSLAPSAKDSRQPGRYSAVTVASGASLTLSTGTYYLASLDLEPNGTIILNQTAGPVLIYVQASPILRGSFITTVPGAMPDLLLGYLGTAEAIVEASFVGTIVAPSAKLTLRPVTGGHTGAFFAKNLEVGPGAIINFRPPHVILTTQPPGSPESCVASIQPDTSLTGRAREVQYQKDILRFCTGVGFSACEQTIRARMNVDFTISAASLYTNRMSTGTYIAVLRDRERKLATFRADATLACDVAAHDGDGDFVPDSADACPNTPPLTPVLANGCTNTNVPVGPDVEDVKKVMTTIGVGVDPRCVNAPTPVTPAALGAFRLPSDPSQGKAVWLSRDPGVTTCPLYYQIEVQLTDGAGTRSVTFQAGEDKTLPWINRPSGAVQFNIHATDPGNRGAWANYAVYTLSFRARAFNFAGQRSSWSGYFNLAAVDCVAGQPCQDQ